MTDRLFNVNLETGECVAEREIDWQYKPLHEVITSMLEASLGLAEPTLDITSEMGHDFMEYTVSVSGKRQLTDAERKKITDERDLQHRQQEYMRGMPR